MSHELKIASMRPQRFSCGILRRAKTTSTSCSGFNEAAAFQLRNRDIGLSDTGHRVCASMRPQRFSCGISACAKHMTQSWQSFNEAAAFQLRNPACGCSGCASRRVLQ